MIMISKEKIQEATQKLVEAYNPMAIYLFGSYAWGKPNVDSDLDFMVILPDEIAITRDLRVKSSYALWDVKIATDVLFKHKLNFDQRATHPSTLEHKIKTEGIIVYGNS